MEELIKRKFIYANSYSIYNGVAGLYDLGPLGTKLQNNIVEEWKKQFVLSDGMLEITSPSLTPKAVFKASGHLEKFSDFMVKDKQNGQLFRADKLLEEYIDKKIAKGKLNSEEMIKFQFMRKNADNYVQDELKIIFEDLQIKSPETGNELTEPTPINLMFETQLGYLRPETAQGIFVNFKRLLDFNNGKMPFAAAQVGLAFRNEISPRSGLVRLREFMLAEIEHFYTDRCDIDFLPKISKEIKFDLLSGINVQNPLLAYYMIKAHMFLQSLGIPKEAMRFRQHQENEKAHYANDCWDIEVYTSSGWIEVVGIADR